ncbi:unnamed protein product [Chrysoparadoxa australica]
MGDESAGEATDGDGDDMQDIMEEGGGAEVEGEGREVEGEGWDEEGGGETNVPLREEETGDGEGDVEAAADCPWERYWDESHEQYYYYNATTDSTQWTVPEGFEHIFDEEGRPQPDSEAVGVEIDAEARDDAGLEGSGDDAMGGEEEQMEEVSDAGSKLEGDEDVGIHGWTWATDDKGRTYYYHTVTQVTTWDEPEELKRAREEGAELPPADDVGYDGGMELENLVVPEEEEEMAERAESSLPAIPSFGLKLTSAQVEEAKHPAESAAAEAPPKKPLKEQVQELEAELQEADAIMEVNSFKTMLEFMKKSTEADPTLTKGTQASAGMQWLIQGYTGYAQYCKLLCDWLEAASATASPEDALRDHLRQLIKDKFDPSKADKLLEGARKVPQWLQELQEQPYWRKALIELFDEHRSSVLMRYVLKTLSDMGHHDEIAAVVSVADIFHVFNGVLQDRLGQVPCADSSGVSALVPDLQRMCCGTGYMYMYSQELLRLLEAGAPAAVRKRKREGQSEDEVELLGRMCTSKYRRVREEVVEHAFKVRGKGASAWFLKQFGHEHSRREQRRHPAVASAVLNLMEHGDQGGSKAKKRQDDELAAALSGLIGAYYLEPVVDALGSEDQSQCPGLEEAAWKQQARPPVHYLWNAQVRATLVNTVFDVDERSPVMEVRRKSLVLLAYQASVGPAECPNTEGAAAAVTASGIRSDLLPDMLKEGQHAAADPQEVLRLAKSLEKAAGVCLSGKLGQSAALEGDLLQLMEEPVVAVSILSWAQVPLSWPESLSVCSCAQVIPRALLYPDLNPTQLALLLFIGSLKHIRAEALGLPALT